MSRSYSLRQPEHEVTSADVYIFSWGDLEDADVVSHLCFQNQFLDFFRYVIDNLQSRPINSPNASPMPLKYALRAGALKAYVQLAVSILEGALAELAVKRDPEKRSKLHKLSFGALLQFWYEQSKELEPIRTELDLLNKYRNFVHLANAAANDESYWKDIIENEASLLAACDKAIKWVSDKCDGLHEYRQETTTSLESA